MIRPTYPEWHLYDWRPCIEEGCAGIVTEYRTNDGKRILAWSRCCQCGTEHTDTIREVAQ